MGLVASLSFIHWTVFPTIVRSKNAIIVIGSYSCAVLTAGAGRIKYTKNGQIINLATMNWRISIFVKLSVKRPQSHFSKYPPSVVKNILLFAGSFWSAVFRLLSPSPASTLCALCCSNSCAETLPHHTRKICVDLATVSQVKPQLRTNPIYQRVNLPKIHMKKSSLPNPRYEVKPRVLTIHTIYSVSNFWLGLTWPGGIGWIQLMFTCVGKKRSQIRDLLCGAGQWSVWCWQPSF